MNYTDLRQWDELPMVGVLQLLLNRTGASLVVDGMFREKTLAAVKQFQRSHRLVPDGKVGEQTWGRLTAGVQLPIVDTVDIFDPDFLYQDAADVKRVGGHPLLIGGACNGVEQVVNLLAGYRNVFLLRLHGHGGPGIAAVSAGQGKLDPHGVERDVIFEDPVLLTALARLRPIFGPYGCVEFNGCEVGRGPYGRSLLAQLAARLNVPVTGALEDQPFIRMTSFRLLGPVFTAIPGGGTLKSWCQARPRLAEMCVA